MQAPISLCLIVRNEPLLEKCILSIRDYVKEIVIVDTGSTDNSQEIGKKYADIFEVFTKCNDPETGLIENFSEARQRSFDLATQPWVMWADSDDILAEAENLAKIVAEFSIEAQAHPIAFMFPYEYSYDEKGQCTCLHYRERLVSNKSKFHWVNPVHEVLLNNESNTVFYTREDVIFKHQRQYSAKPHEPGRNLRILKKYLEKTGDTDARQLYYIGLEYCNAGLVEESIQHLIKYIDLSGWDDERAMAALKLVDIYQMKADYREGLKWAFKTIALKENWGEGYFALGKMFYFLAQNDPPGEIRNWQRSVHFIKIGLDLPPTKTLLFVNPLDREYDIHRYYNFALSKIGDIKAALQSVNTGLKKKEDPGFLLNKKIYETTLSIQQITAEVNKLKELNHINQASSELITGIINKQLATESSVREQSSVSSTLWNIPTNNNFDEPPLSINSEQLQTAAIMFWKQYMLYDEIESAIKFLENVPSIIKNTELTQRALTMTRAAVAKLENVKINEYTPSFSQAVDGKLDIIFYAGNGVEVWTPETVKKQGIGGSETMLMEQAKRLSALGHKVRVYNSCGDKEGFYDGVEYQQSGKFQNLTCDVLIVSRQADKLADQYNIQAKLKLLWVHDVYAINANNELLLKADKILALSNWHKQNIINVHNVHPDHVVVTRNGIDLERFNKKITRNKYKAVNSSSPDRSWPILLDCWPRIKAAVPQAELHLFYGFKNWEYAAQFDKGQADLIVRLKQQIKDMASQGVVFHDRVDQEELAREFLSAGVWAHSTWFTETSCITAMEAQAAGLRIVTSSIAALNETVSDRGVLLDGDWVSEEYKNAFVGTVINAMNYDGDEDRNLLRQYAKEHFGLDDLARDWEKMFYELLGQLKENPINPYYPTPPYRKQVNG
jgi:glycosyltransferase involved in cell wall biosynthesis